MTPELLILNHHLSNRVFDFSSERFGVLLFPLSRCCGASTAVAAKKFEPPQGQRPSGHRGRSNRKRQQKWRVFLCAARAVVLSRACNEVGHGRSPCAFSRRFCAVKSGAAGGGSFHDLRHTFATHALTSGVDVKTLSGILGHTRATFTLDTYTHTTGDMQKRAAEIVDEFLTDIFGEELKPWQENEKTEKELSA